ncbi:MGMT family protein [Halomonas salifodinae]|uniref:MGMT family protein n=1 Tax=Halomonas salifodinae TaxID=438745 RepID=A0ABW2F003_9GAMM
MTKKRAPHQGVSRREAIYTIVAAIPPGRVTSYGRIATLAEGLTARLVARALGELPAGHGLPWQRVIRSDRRLADHPGAARQRALLEDEGVGFDDRGRVPERFFWP